MVVGLLSTALTTSLILFPLYQFEILRIPKFLPIPVLAVMGFAAILNVLLVGLMGIFLTHKVAGPMYSLVRHFRSIEEEGVWAGNMRLREGDDLRYVVRNFNGMMDAIGQSVKNDLEVLEDLRKSIEDSDLSSEEKLEKTNSAINELEADLRYRIGKGQDSRAS